jgi:Fe-S cluster biogenesis protein NfuA/nitrite reductase/ring-hydroxylating ferredoxin subunit
LNASAEKPAGIELDALLGDLSRLEEIVAGWDEQKRGTVDALKLAIDDLNKEAFTRLIRTIKSNPACIDSLREAVSDEVVYSVLRHHQLIKASLDERVEQALDSVRPFLESHGGDVELVKVEPPNQVTIRLIGACDGCPASGLTLSEGVEKAIKEFCPEITEIHKAAGGALAKPVDGVAVHFISPFACSQDSGWIHAAELDEIPEAGIKPMDLAGQSILLSRQGSRVTCFQNACAHLGMPLDMGIVHEGILQCPHHGFEYALDSGKCLTAPEVQLQPHAVRVIGNRVEVRFS